MGPFTIKTLIGDNTVNLNLTDRFRLLNSRVNISYLRPYRLRTTDIGPPPARLSTKPVSVEPDGSGWYQIEEILDHRGSAGPNGECLVRWKDFDTSHDSWIRSHSVTPLALRAYEEFLSAHVEYLQRIADRSRHKVDVSRDLAGKKHLDSFIGRVGAFSVLQSQSSNAQVSVQNSDSVSSDSSPIVTTSETSDVAKNAPSVEIEVVPVE